MGNRGLVRGGSNSYGRLHVAAVMPHLKTQEEAYAVAEGWAAGLGLSVGFAPSGGNEYELIGSGGSIYYRCTTRRHFALLPAFLRLVTAGGGDAVAQLWDAGEHGASLVYSARDQPADFWREVALAQMYRGA